MYGWLARKRFDCFLVLRDAYGSVQARIPDGREDLQQKVKGVDRESVVKITGIVADRGEQYRNPKMQTGDIEVS